MARAVAGLFPTRPAAEGAIVALKNAGFDESKISVVMQDQKEQGEVTHEHGTHTVDAAVGGGLVGGTAGALLAATGAIAISSVVLPGIGGILAGGIIASVLGGTAGWLVGGLLGLGIPKEEAEYYQTRVQGGDALVTVDAGGRDAEARQILLASGAEDLQGRGYGGGYEAVGTTVATGTGMVESTTTNTIATAPVQPVNTTPVTPSTTATTMPAGGQVQGGRTGDENVTVDTTGAGGFLVDHTGEHSSN